MRRRLILSAVLCVGLIGVVVIAAGGPPPSASGTGQNDDEGVLTTFSATDHTKPGDVTPQISGIAKERDLFTGNTITIDIDCLQVTGNLAVMSGPVLRAPAGVPLGVDMFFSVRDNGEGSNATGPDMFDRFQPGTCDKIKIKEPAIESQRGNIQVRGGSSGSTCPIGYRQCCPGYPCTPIDQACPACPATK